MGLREPPIDGRVGDEHAVVQEVTRIRPTPKVVTEPSAQPPLVVEPHENGPATSALGAIGPGTASTENPPMNLTSCRILSGRHLECSCERGDAGAL